MDQEVIGITHTDDPYEGHFRKFVLYAGCTSNIPGAPSNTQEKIHP